MFRGSATSDGNFTYFTPRGSHSVYSYKWSIGKWKELPHCPVRNAGLVIINGALTTVGGGHFTNKLNTLQQGEWVELYPRLHTGRDCPAVVSMSDGQVIICIGGNTGLSVPTPAVELLDVKNRIWYKVTELPDPLRYPSATICGDKLHVIGVGGVGYSCSLQALLSGGFPLHQAPLLISWTPLPHPPVMLAVAASLRQELVLVGGDQVGLVDTIHQLVGQEWVKIGTMCNTRKSCLVASVSPDHILIVGGVGADDKVEECIVTAA